jgi:hypothetical protein
MADIIKDNIEMYIRALISKGLDPHRKEEKVLWDTRKQREMIWSTKEKER